MPSVSDDSAIAAVILRLTGERGVDKSICPTDAARVLDARETPDGWRRWLPQVRRVAQTLAQDGRIDILRKGRAIDPAELRGVIRLRLKAPGPEKS